MLFCLLILYPSNRIDNARCIADDLFAFQSQSGSGFFKRTYNHVEIYETVPARAAAAGRQQLTPGALGSHC